MRTTSFCTKWQRMKSSHVRSAEMLWTLFGQRGTIPRPAFPPTVLSTRTRPTLPYFLPSPPLAARLPTGPRFCPQRGLSHLTSHVGWWKPSGPGEKEQGQECGQHLDEKRKCQNLRPEWRVEGSSNFGGVSLEISALTMRTIRNILPLPLGWEIITCRNLREYELLLWRKTIVALSGVFAFNIRQVAEPRIFFPLEYTNFKWYWI